MTEISSKISSIQGPGHLNCLSLCKGTNWLGDSRNSVYVWVKVPNISLLGHTIWTNSHSLLSPAAELSSRPLSPTRQGC